MLCIGIIAVSIAGCKKNEIVDPSTALITPFQGITRTDVTGTVLEADSNDWKPLTDAGMRFQPGAYPNPCRVDTGFQLAFHLFSSDSVDISINDAPNHILRTIISRRLIAGNYEVASRVSGFSPAIYRIYCRVIRAESTYVTYGDVQVLN